MHAIHWNHSSALEARVPCHFAYRLFRPVDPLIGYPENLHKTLHNFLFDGNKSFNYRRLRKSRPTQNVESIGGNEATRFHNSA